MKNYKKEDNLNKHCTRRTNNRDTRTTWTSNSRSGHYVHQLKPLCSYNSKIDTFWKSRTDQK